MFLFKTHITLTKHLHCLILNLEKVVNLGCKVVKTCIKRYEILHIIHCMYIVAVPDFTMNILLHTNVTIL